MQICGAEFRLSLLKLMPVSREDKRMASRLIRNQLPSNGLRVRPPCPPLAIRGIKRLIADIPQASDNAKAPS